MSERGQAAIEIMAVVPLCLVCAWGLVEAGLVIRDRIAVSQAASQAAHAAVTGGDPAAAARKAAPAHLRGDLHTERSGSSIVVRSRSSARLLALAGAGDVRSEVRLSEVSR